MGDSAGSRFNGPVELAADAGGHVYVADAGNDSLRHVSAAGVVTTLKQYADRCGPVSKTSDKDDSTTTLGDSEELSVQHSPRHAIPEVIQVADDGGHVPAAVDGE